MLMNSFNESFAEPRVEKRRRRSFPPSPHPSTLRWISSTTTFYCTNSCHELTFDGDQKTNQPQSLKQNTGARSDWQRNWTVRNVNISSYLATAVTQAKRKTITW